MRRLEKRTPASTVALCVILCARGGMAGEVAVPDHGGYLSGSAVHGLDFLAEPERFRDGFHQIFRHRTLFRVGLWVASPSQPWSIECEWGEGLECLEMKVERDGVELLQERVRFAVVDGHSVRASEWPDALSTDEFPGFLEAGEIVAVELEIRGESSPLEEGRYLVDFELRTWDPRRGGRDREIVLRDRQGPHRIELRTPGSREEDALEVLVEAWALRSQEKWGEVAAVVRRGLREYPESVDLNWFLATSAALQQIRWEESAVERSLRRLASLANAEASSRAKDGRPPRFLSWSAMTFDRHGVAALAEALRTSGYVVGVSETDRDP